MNLGQAGNSNGSSPEQIFISYSHSPDDAEEKRRVMLHLGVLQAEGLIDLWDDTRIATGDTWFQEIETALRSARIAILLLSPSFLTSKFILVKEVPQLLQRRKTEGLRLMPILIKPCAWQAVGWLLALQIRQPERETFNDSELATVVLEVNALLSRSTRLAPEVARTQQVTMAVAGLDSMAEMAQVNPSVQSIMREFSADFQHTRAEIDVVTDYKRLHEILHRIQTECFDALLSELRRYTKPEESASAGRNALRQLIKLDGFVTQLKRVRAAGAFPTADVSWIDELDTVRQELWTGINASEVGRVQDAETDLTTIMLEEPSRMNHYLTTRARLLKLDAVERMVRHVRSRLAAQPHDSADQEREMTQTIDALATTHQNLQRLIDDHDIWQRVEVKLRTVERELESSDDEPKRSWRSIKRMTEPLYRGRTEPWASELLAEAVRVQDAIESGRRQDAKDYFLNFRIRATNQFLDADTELMDFCGNKLREIDQPLNRLLSAVGAMQQR
jgi:hypothetical protein